MSIGAGILLSAIFLGCVFLYIKSDNKQKWRKVVLVVVITLLIAIIGFISYIVLYENYFKQSSATNREKSSAKYSVYDIGPGDKLSDIQFRNGKAKKENKLHEGYKVYKYDIGVEIWAKDDVADYVFYSCRNSDYTMIDKIMCGATEQNIFDSYKKNNVTVYCSDNVELRIYEIKDKPLNFVLQKNKVIYMGIFNGEKERLRPTSQKACN